jgi:hypothetical protein
MRWRAGPLDADAAGVEHPDMVREPTPERHDAHDAAAASGSVAAALAVLVAQPLLVVIPLVLFAAAVTTTALTTGPTLCPFRWLTGLPCAGCGLTRGFVALTHGHVHAAHVYNPLTGVVMATMVGWWAAAVVQLWRGKSTPAPSGRVVAGAVALALAFWLARDLAILLR